MSDDRDWGPVVVPCKEITTEHELSVALKLRTAREALNKACREAEQVLGSAQADQVEIQIANFFLERKRRR